MSGWAARTVSTERSMEPRWTGMCGALATSAPVRSKTAHEKSSRSLMFTDEAVFWSVTPICSAIDMKRLLKISSITGSASVPMARSRRNAADGLRLDRLRHQRLLGMDEAELLAVRRLEIGPHVGDVAGRERDRDRGVCTFVAQMGLGIGRDIVLRHALPG